MIRKLDSIAQAWIELYIIANVQFVLFGGGLLLLMFALRNNDVRILRLLALLGVIKAAMFPLLPFLPPVPLFFGAEASPALQSIVHQVVSIADRPVGISAAWWMFAWIVGVAIFFSTVILSTRAVSKPVTSRISINQYTPTNVSIGRVKAVEGPADCAPHARGFVRQLVVLPQGWSRWPAETLRVVVAHELAHLKSGDTWWQLIQRSAVALFFPNPLVWWISKRLTLYMETACDQKAARWCGLDHQKYCEHLVEAVELMRHSAIYGAQEGLHCSLGHPLRRRISYLLSSGRRRSRGIYVAVVALTAVTLIPLSLRLSLTHSGQAPSVLTSHRSNSPSPLDEQELREALRAVGEQLLASSSREPERLVQVHVDASGKHVQTRLLRGEPSNMNRVQAAIASVPWIPASRLGRAVPAKVTVELAPVTEALRSGNALSTH